MNKKISLGLFPIFIYTPGHEDQCRCCNEAVSLSLSKIFQTNDLIFTRIIHQVSLKRHLIHCDSTQLTGFTHNLHFSGLELPLQLESVQMQLEVQLPVSSDCFWMEACRILTTICMLYHCCNKGKEQMISSRDCIIDLCGASLFILCLFMVQVYLKCDKCYNIFW